MEIHILTLFPEMFLGPFQESIVKRAVERGLARIHIHNIRDYAQDKHRVVDDYPFGGGGGMVLKPEPLFLAVKEVKSRIAESGGPQQAKETPVVLLCPQGEVLTQGIVEDLTSHRDLILICGHYEGVDERVREHLVDREISIGDYVLSGGEIPAMVIVDALVRLIPGAVGDTRSLADDSHASGLIQFPQYTRPAEYHGWTVPPVLLSGNHQEVQRWRRQQSLLRTLGRRPDMLAKASLRSEDRLLLEDSEKQR
ncbi:tRNA (guanosine(37)-N1)-methyltransferase TrmD [SAR202 cluster bacterium AC-647-N09_OGT_505m]|nr:tRNA (guanosine(37)-N1)-methyltransferase TrmD [SAR202 cluster bacterium AC-647-N09_OGT_505m]